MDYDGNIVYDYFGIYTKHDLGLDKSDVQINDLIVVDNHLKKDRVINKSHFNLGKVIDINDNMLVLLLYTNSTDGFISKHRVHYTNVKLQYSDKKMRKLNHREASWAVAKELNGRLKTFSDMEIDNADNNTDFLNQKEYSQRDDQADGSVVSFLVKKVLKFIMRMYKNPQEKEKAFRLVGYWVADSFEFEILSEDLQDFLKEYYFEGRNYEFREDIPGYQNMALMMKSFQKRGRQSENSRRDENKYDVDFAFYYTCKYAIREFLAELYGIINFFHLKFYAIAFCYPNILI
jgi:hypothetical protein